MSLAVFRLPYGGFVLCLTIEFDGDLMRTVDILRRTTFDWKSIEIDGRGLKQAAEEMAVGQNILELVDLSDIHHVLRVDDGMIPIFSPLPSSVDIDVKTSDGQECPRDVSRDVIQQLVFRSFEPVRTSHAELKFPVAINRTPGTVVAVGAAVTVISRQRIDVEGWILWSLLQLTCSLARLRQVRRDTFAALEAMSGAYRRRTGRRSVIQT